MNNLKISHQNTVIVNKVIASLSVKYGKIGDMTVKGGKKHDYLERPLTSLKTANVLLTWRNVLMRH